jgi:hypothetical protein
MGLDITGLGSVFDFGSKIIDKIFPDKDKADQVKFEMLKLQQAGEFKELDQAFELAKSQIEVNKVEAAQEGLLSKWRPALGWVCVSSYAYNFVLMPLIVWTVTLINGTSPAMIALDTTELGVLLAGMLGLGGMRSYDKTKVCK